MSEPLRIAIAGLGTVGVGTVKVLQENAALLSARSGCDITIVAVSARSDKDRGVDLSGVRFERDAKAFIGAEDIDAVVELIGGDSGIAHDLVKGALAAGQHVVTANKALIAKHGAELAEIAEEQGVTLAYEAAVAGGIPIIQALGAGLVANRYERISGILNGTSNFILTTMEKHGRSYDDVYSEAESLGYLEADPSLDIDGIDAAHKLAIITALAYGVRPDMQAIYTQGIGDITIEDMRYAEELGYTIKLLATTQDMDGKILQRVHPAMVPSESALGVIDGANNAIHVKGNAVGAAVFEGPGAGELPTASSVVADIISIARGDRYYPFSIAAKQLGELKAASMEDLICSYYMRLSVKDEPGVLAALATICAKHGVSIEALEQTQSKGDKSAEIVITTHETLEKEMRLALAEIAALPTTLEKPTMIRIEEM